MKVDKIKRKLTSKEKYYCVRCGKEISKEEYEENNGFCEDCYWLEEDELDEEFLF